MKRKDFGSETCPIARAVDVVGDPWSLLVIREAFLGIRRFDDFLGRLGIARNVLAARLALLVERGVLARERYQEHPERFDYVLTEKGLDLAPVLLALMSWGDRWEPSVHGPPVRLVDKDTGEPVRVAIVSAKTGRSVAREDLRVVPGPSVGRASRGPIPPALLAGATPPGAPVAED